MTILFASNDPADFSGGYIKNTTAGRFRATHVAHAFESGGDAAPTEAFTQNNPAAAGDITWYHVQMWHNDSCGGNNATGKFWCTGYDAAGKRIFTFDCGGTGGVAMRVYGSSTVSHIPNGQNTPWPSVSTLMDWDLKVDLSGSDIVVSLYRDQSSTPYFTATATNNGKTNPVALVWQAYDWENSGSNWHQVGSEFIVADEDTRGMGLSNLFTYAAGAHSDWVGDAADLSDEDAETGMTVDTTGQKVSRAIATYGGPASTLVRGVFLQLRAGVSGAVGDLRGLARESAVDYVTADAGVPAARTTGVLVGFDDDPDTETGWDTADLTNFEFGVESVA